MLKIKDRVPLSELEKFGFVKDEFGEYELSKWHCCCANITIDKNRVLCFCDEWWGDDFELIDILFDLIKADLVEKVENEM